MFNKKILASASAIVTAFAFVAVAGANVSGTTGSIVEIDPPASVVHHTLESDTDIILFGEAQNVILSNNVRVDVSADRDNRRLRTRRSVIVQGTVVNSYLLHTDPIDHPRRGIKYEGKVTFDEKILGVVTKSRKLNATDYELGSNVTTYPSRTALRGLESGRRADALRISPDGHTLTVRFKTSVAIDQVRVITAASNDQPDTGPNEGGDTLSDGLVGHWTFENGSGQSVTDHSGNDNNGVFGGSSEDGSNDLSWTTDSAIGDYALDFDGIDDFVVFADNPEFEQSTYSWSMWLNAPDAPSNTSIGQPMSNADEQFVSSWDHTHPGFIASAAHKSGSEWVGVQIQNPLTGGEWHHVTATYDGSELKIYLNGSLEESAFVGAPNSNSGSLHLGAGYYSGGPASFYEGKIDEVRIYDRALTESEIAQLATR